MSHTSGPWEAEHRSPLPVNRYHVKSKSSGGYIALVYEHDEDSEANANLIAAAPELLKALKAVIAEADGGWLRESETAELCLAVIAKAEGRA